MRSLCVQFGSSRLKATVWDDVGMKLQEAWSAYMDEKVNLGQWAEQNQVERILISDVCGYPPLNPEIGRRAHLISHEDLRSYCDYPDADFFRVGVDRLLLTAAVVEAGVLPCLAIDFGTHTTVNQISGEGKLVGGWIIPGLSVWKKSSEMVSPQLGYHHAPFCFLPQALDLFPADTQGALLAGFLQSYAHVLMRLKRQRLPWVVTGGDRDLFRAFFPSQVHEDSYWVERGMLAVASHAPVLQ